MLTTTDLCRIFNVHCRTITDGSRLGALLIRAGGEKADYRFDVESVVGLINTLTMRQSSDCRVNHQGRHLPDGGCKPAHRSALGGIG